MGFAIEPQVSEQKIFEGRLPYMGHGGHLGHVTSIMLTHFYFFVHESLFTPFCSKWPSGIRERPV